MDCVWALGTGTGVSSAGTDRPPARAGIVTPARLTRAGPDGVGVSLNRQLPGGLASLSNKGEACRSICQAAAKGADEAGHHLVRRKAATSRIRNRGSPLAQARGRGASARFVHRQQPGDGRHVASQRDGAVLQQGAGAAYLGAAAASSLRQDLVAGRGA